MSSKTSISKQVNINNRKASHEYHFIDKYIAGIVLTGTEIKSVRMSNVNLQHAYCVINKGEIFVKEMHISQYSLGTHYNHEPTRERKLLLSKKEIEKLESKGLEKGLTIIPTRMFVNDRGLAKVEIALAQGKKLHDKRHDIRDKDLKREMARMKL